MASGSLSRLARCAEVTRGTTPATPAFTRLRDSRFTGGLTRDGIKDNAVRGDRNLNDYRLGKKAEAFSMPFSLAYGAYDVELEALLCGTWTANVLKNGTTRRYFTYEREFTDIQSSDSPFHRHKGCELNTMELTVSNGGAIVEGSFGMIGRDMAMDTVGITGATYAAASTNQAFGSFDGDITEGGSAIAIVTEFKLNVANGIEAMYAIGAPESNDSVIGDFDVTGSIGVQFRNGAMLTKYLAETPTSLGVTLSDLAGNSLLIGLPNVILNGGSPDVSGPGMIPLTIPFVAKYDRSSACTISLTRTPAT